MELLRFADRLTEGLGWIPLALVLCREIAIGMRNKRRWSLATNISFVVVIAIPTIRYVNAYALDSAAEFPLSVIFYLALALSWNFVLGGTMSKESSILLDTYSSRKQGDQSIDAPKTPFLVLAHRRLMDAHIDEYLIVHLLPLLLIVLAVGWLLLDAILMLLLAALNYEHAWAAGVKAISAGLISVVVYTTYLNITSYWRNREVF